MTRKEKTPDRRRKPRQADDSCQLVLYLPPKDRGLDLLRLCVIGLAVVYSVFGIWAIVRAIPLCWNGG